MTTIVCLYCQELAGGNIDFIKSLPLEPFIFSGWYQMYPQTTFFTASQDRWETEEKTPEVAQANHTLSPGKSCLKDCLADWLCTVCWLYLRAITWDLVWLLGSWSHLLAWSSLCRPGWFRFDSVCQGNGWRVFEENSREHLLPKANFVLSTEN